MREVNPANEKIRQEQVFPLPVTAVQRFMGKIQVSETGCWLWLSTVNRGGYGRFGLSGIQWSAHRVSFLHFKGPIPAGLEIDHICRVRRCVNPRHLRAVTKLENLAAAVWPEECPKGHNDWIYNYRAARICRLCKEARLQARRDKRYASQCLLCGKFSADYGIRRHERMMHPDGAPRPREQLVGITISRTEKE